MSGTSGKDKAVLTNYPFALAQGLPSYRNMIIKELLKPLETASANESSKESIDLKPYKSSLEAIISGIRGEIHSWAAT